MNDAQSVLIYILCLLCKQSRDKSHDFQMFGFLIAARSSYSDVYR